MNYSHTPVLLDECIKMLDIKSNGIYIDGTIGGAGHSTRIIEKLGSGGVLIGLDKDEDAIKASKQRLTNIKSNTKIILRNCSFKHMMDICNENGINQVDGILLDLGVSSYQLEKGDRGFSYNKDAALDMRMDKNQALTAEIIINEYDEKEIARIIREYGEERWALRIARFIAEERKRKRISTTVELVNIIKSAIPASARRRGPHPAKRTFQALRITVNDELATLKESIGIAVSILKQEGRLCIISFHSLEDRIVKKEFLSIANLCECPEKFTQCIGDKKPGAIIITKKPIVPTKEEQEGNARARSAKLRVLEKI
jgi:16S rRNA (cytosine1402-N4)-methyltransferase